MKAITALFFAITSVLWADQITLNNGDHITGGILKSDTKELVIDTPSAGKVTVAWPSITEINGDGPLYVTLSDGQTVAGALRTINGTLQVTTRDTGTVTTPFANIRGVRNQVEQTAFETETERLTHPRLVDLWQGFVDFGFAAARGNANTRTFTTAARADRATNRDKISVYFNSIFSSNSTNGPLLTTANARRGGITYDVNIDKKWFAWAATDLEYDQFQSLDLRFVPAGGIGHHTINTMSDQLDLRFGVTANNEYFNTGLTRHSAELLIGQDYVHNFNEKTVFQEHFRYFPNMTDSGQSRINFDATLAVAIAKWLAVQLTASDRYLSNPVQGRKTNDILYSAGIRLSFGGK
jgi:putative salt-induced outer membrane protein YdiY